GIGKGPETCLSSSACTHPPRGRRQAVRCRYTGRNLAAEVSQPVSSRVMSAPPNSTTPRHELLFLNYFRLAQALVYVGLAFTPAGMGWPHLDSPGLARLVAVTYLLFAVAVVSINHMTRALG